MPDHEVITAAFIRKNFVGRQTTIDGAPYRLTQEDVDFIAEVIGDHENIEKEEGRRNFISSDLEAERSKALFFIADVLTGVIVQKEAGNFSIDLAQLDTRFTDLYFRHIDLVKGKIFRPQWGAYAIGDLLTTIKTLEQKGLNIILSADGRDVSKILIDAGLEAIDRALTANNERTDHKFSKEQPEAVEKAKSSLSAMLNER